MSEPKAEDAETTCFRIKYEEDGVRISWGDDPLDFVWQSTAQACDLINKLCYALVDRTPA